MIGLESVLQQLPFYGGTSPASTVPAATTPVTGVGTPAPAATEATPAPAATEVAPAGGVEDDPLTKLAADPNALGQLLSQVDKLQSDLKKVTGERDKFVSDQEAEQRKQQTREQQLETDLQQRDAVIQQMDAVIRNMAIGNAMLSQPDIQWHSVKQAMAELNPEAFDIDVDLEHGTANVNGIETESKRIARECEWLVKKAGSDNSGSGSAGTRTSTSTKPRGSGSPPSPLNGSDVKSQKRSDLMKRFPVIAHGRG